MYGGRDVEPRDVAHDAKRVLLNELVVVANMRQRLGPLEVALRDGSGHLLALSALGWVHYGIAVDDAIGGNDVQAVRMSWGGHLVTHCKNLRKGGRVELVSEGV